MQRYDVASTLRRRCIDVMCLLTGYYRINKKYNLILPEDINGSKLVLFTKWPFTKAARHGDLRRRDTLGIFYTGSSFCDFLCMG